MKAKNTNINRLFKHMNKMFNYKFKIKQKIKEEKKKLKDLRSQALKSVGIKNK